MLFSPAFGLKINDFANFICVVYTCTFSVCLKVKVIVFLIHIADDMVNHSVVQQPVLHMSALQKLFAACLKQ